MTESHSIETLTCSDCGKPTKTKSRCRSCGRRSTARIPSVLPRYGKLQVVGTPYMIAGECARKKRRWHVAVLCDCGTEKLMLVQNLVKSDSCGCDRVRLLVETNTKHGGSRSVIYKVWGGMLTRCYSENHPTHKHYGARGIFVCDEWQNDFTAFRDWAMENGWQRGLEIDRKDNNGPYSPENCRVTDRKTNNRNKRDTVLHEAFGESKCLPEWAEDPRCLVSKRTLSARISYGWDILLALTTPVIPRSECGKLTGWRHGKNNQHTKRRLG